MINKELGKLISVSEEAGTQNERGESEIYHSLLDHAYTIRDNLAAKLVAAEALAVALDEILTDFLHELDYVYEGATGRIIEQSYPEEVERFRETLRQYREVAR